MFNKILLCVDGSACALDAAQTASGIAQSFRSSVTALNVFRWGYAELSSIGVWALAIDQDTIDQGAKECLAAIESEVQRIFEPSKVPLHFVQSAGHEAEVDAILRVATQEGSDLIVIGSRGLRGAKELFLGSVSSGVLHHAECPVLIVRGGNTPCGVGRFHNILLASDGSPCAQKASSIAVGMAQKLGADLTAINAYEELSAAIAPANGGAVVRETENDVYAKQWLEYVAEPIRRMAEEAGVTCSFVQERGEPEETILAFATQHENDLIVLGSRGLRGYQRMLLGSVSNRVVHGADCPVLIVR